MKTLRTPDERFTGLPGFNFAPNYIEISDSEGGTLRVHYLREGDPDGPVVLAATPEAPSAGWLDAFVTGTRAATRELGSATAANDVAWASLEISGLALLVGRPGRPFRARERRQLATLSRIADHRWRELVVRDGRRAHPATARNDR